MTVIFGINIKVIYGKVNMPLAMGAAKSLITADGKFILVVPHIAIYSVDAASSLVLIEKATPHITNDHVLVYLTGTIAAYLLQYQDYLVLHGSAVLINNCAVIFSGNSGAGKSTTATALVERGYKLLTDDVVVIKKDNCGRLVLVPGPARVKLWKETLAHLNKPIDNLTRILAKLDKYEYPIDNHYNQSVEISALYELNHSPNIQNIEIEKLIGINKLNVVINNTYRYHMLKPLGKIPNHLQQSIMLTKLIQIFKVTRPTQKFMLEELVKEIIRHAVKPYSSSHE
ncbi:MAG: hypothetical protein QG673_881 [Pseudomonadota bacterium]|nr:hypothetical protein [Pseudomonadota bacterium]